MKNAENLRKRICQFYEKKCENGNKATLQHFLAEGVAQSTIYDAIQRVKSGIGAIRRVGLGRISLKIPREKVRQDNSTKKTESLKDLLLVSTKSTNRTFASFLKA